MSVGSSGGTSSTPNPVTQELQSDSTTVEQTASQPVASSDRSLIDLVVEETESAQGQQRATLLERFLQEESSAKAIAFWVNQSGLKKPPQNAGQLTRMLSRDIARLDGMLNRQVNAIIHSSKYQELESSWRGLHYLVNQVPEGENIQVRLLNASWRDLSRDFDRASEFDQSHLFRLVYNNEFGMPGGKPYGVLLGDYAIRPRPGAGHPTDDIATLRSMSGVAAASFAPFIAGVDPAMFGLDNFTELEQPIDLHGAFQQADYVKWRSFRETEDSRFIGLTLPQVLMRVPYEDNATRVDGFRFQEDVQSPDRSRYLWGNACYGFGAVLVRAFAEHGWLADIRGVHDNDRGGGLVEGLPVHSFNTDKRGIAPKSSTDAIISDMDEKDLSELGFIPLCRCKDTEFSAFHSNQSTQVPKEYDRAIGTANARLSSMIQYMLCVSRFAHYIKVIGRDKMGSFASASDCQAYLDRWLQNYVVSDDKASHQQKAAYPLREAQVQVRETPGKPGTYSSVVHLKPHFQLDQLVTAVKLTTELVAAKV